MRQLLLLPLVLLSCTAEHNIVDYTNGTTHLHRDRMWGTIGGSGATQSGPDGSEIQTYDTAQSFGNAMTAGTTIGGGLILSSAQKAQEVTKKISNTNALKAAQAKEAAAAAASKATPVITNPNQVVTFPPQ